jgi:hypothetical protein
VAAAKRNTSAVRTDCDESSIVATRDFSEGAVSMDRGGRAEMNVLASKSTTK